MARYMIEVSHQPDKSACLRMLDAFMQAGAHYLTNADWGCLSGHHTAWICVEAENDAQARLMVPPVVRQMAVLAKVDKFTAEQIKTLLESSKMAG